MSTKTATLPRTPKPGKPVPSPAELFTGHLPLAWKLAGRFALRYGIPIGDCKDEAETGLAFIIAEWNTTDSKRFYNPALRSPTSWVYLALFNHMRNFATRKQPRERRFTDCTPAGGELPPALAHAAEPERKIDRILRDLQTDAKRIATIILYGPWELMQELAPHGRTVGARRARAAVNGFLDWEAERFDTAWQEVEAALEN